MWPGVSSYIFHKKQPKPDHESFHESKHQTLRKHEQDRAVRSKCVAGWRVGTGQPSVGSLFRTKESWDWGAFLSLDFWSLKRSPALSDHNLWFIQQMLTQKIQQEKYKKNGVFKRYGLLDIQTRLEEEGVIEWGPLNSPTLVREWLPNLYLPFTLLLAVFDFGVGSLQIMFK